jgi:hypothetical protein
VLRLAQLFHAQFRRQTAGVPDAQLVVIHANLDVGGVGVVAVDEGVDDRLTQGIQWILPDLVSRQAFQGRFCDLDLEAHLKEPPEAFHCAIQLLPQGAAKVVAIHNFRGAAENAHTELRLNEVHLWANAKE